MNISQVSGIVYSKEDIFSPSAYKKSVFGDASMTFFAEGKELRFTTKDTSVLDICSNSSNIVYFVN